MFGDKHAAGRVAPVLWETRKAAPLAGLVAKRAKLYRTYNGREYTASINQQGLINYKGKKYRSATAAAKAIVKHKGAVSGRAFWYIRDANGDWVRLGDYKR